MDRKNKGSVSCSARPLGLKMMSHGGDTGKEIAGARASSIALGESGRLMSREEGCCKSLLEVLIVPLVPHLTVHKKGTRDLKA